MNSSSAGAPYRGDITILRNYESAVSHAQCVRRFLEQQSWRINSRELYLKEEFPLVVKGMLLTLQEAESAVRRQMDYQRRLRKKRTDVSVDSNGTPLFTPAAGHIERGRHSFTRRWSAWLTKPGESKDEGDQNHHPRPCDRRTTTINTLGATFSPVLPTRAFVEPASTVRCESAGPMVRARGSTTGAMSIRARQHHRLTLDRSGTDAMQQQLRRSCWPHETENNAGVFPTSASARQSVSSGAAVFPPSSMEVTRRGSSSNSTSSSSSSSNTPPPPQWTRCRQASYAAMRSPAVAAATSAAAAANQAGIASAGERDEEREGTPCRDGALEDALRAIWTDVETDVEVVADGGVDTDTNSEGGRPAARSSVLETFDGFPHPFWGTEAEQSSWVSVPNPAKLDPECKVLNMLRALANNNTPWPYGSSTLVRHYKAFLKYGLAPRVLARVWAKDLKGAAAAEDATAIRPKRPSPGTAMSCNCRARFEGAADVTTTATTTAFRHVGKSGGSDESPPDVSDPPHGTGCSCWFDTTPCCSQEWRLQAESSRVSGDEADQELDDYEPCPVDPTWRNVYSSKIYVLQRPPKKPLEIMLRQLREIATYSAPVTPTGSNHRLSDSGMDVQLNNREDSEAHLPAAVARHAAMARCDTSWLSVVEARRAELDNIPRSAEVGNATNSRHCGSAVAPSTQMLNNRIYHEYWKRLEKRGKLKVRNGRRAVSNNKEILKEGRDWIRFHQVKEFVPVSRWPSILRPKPVPTPKSLLAPAVEQGRRPWPGGYPSLIPTIMRGPAMYEDLQAKYLHYLWQTRDQPEVQRAKENLKLWIGGYMIPHDQKRYRRGDDSWFGSESLRCFGLCDGVGELGDAQWRVAGFDCRGFGEDILREAKSRIQTIRGATAPLPCTKPRLILPPGKTRAHKEWISKEFTVDPASPHPSVLCLDSLVAGFYGKQSTYGAATCLIGCLDKSGSRVGFANIGDSRAMLLRRDQLSTGSLTSVGSTEAEQHGWNMPVQLARFPDVRRTKNMHKDTRLQQLARQLDNWRATGLDNNDRPETAALYDFNIQEGDLIVLGTDGLWDNLFDADVQALCGVALSPLESEILTGGPFMSTAPRDLAKGLCLAAYWRSMQSDADTPFARSVRQAEGTAYQLGGKADDISVVCLWVVPRRLENTPALLMRCREEKAFSRLKERQRTPRHIPKTDDGTSLSPEKSGDAATEEDIEGNAAAIRRSCSNASSRSVDRDDGTQL